jgi:TonB family protein
MQACWTSFVLTGEWIFLDRGKTMLLSLSRVSWFALFLSLFTLLAALSQAILNVPARQAPQTPLAFTSKQQDQLHNLVTRVLQTDGGVHCRPRDCTILVPNFTLASGATSQLGIQIADQVSKELASEQSAIKIIDHSRLQSFLEEQRIPATLLNDEKAICWLGKQLGANTVLRGTTEDRGGPLRIRASLLSCVQGKTGSVEEFSVPDSDFQNVLIPKESFPETLPPRESSSAPLIRMAGADGVSMPACLYCPDPVYTDPAREAKFKGRVILRITLSEQGHTTEARVILGLPFGLNESAIRAVREWQFKPAKRNGEPVACMVMMESTYRLQ